MEIGDRSSCHQQVQDDVHRQQMELDWLQQQTGSERDALSVLRTEYDSAEQDMESLLEAIDKRQQLLDSLDSQLDSAITTRRRDVEVRLLS